jgi:hypothetical protein
LGNTNFRRHLKDPLKGHCHEKIYQESILGDAATVLKNFLINRFKATVVTQKVLMDLDKGSLEWVFRGQAFYISQSAYRDFLGRYLYV